MQQRITNHPLIRKLSHPASIYLAYVLFTLVLTYPACLGLGREYVIPGARDHDWHLYDIWWVKHAIVDLGTTPTYTTQIWHPFGGQYILSTPFNELATIPLQIGLSLTRAMTFIWLFAFATSGFTAYLLALHFTRNRAASFIAGLVFAFSTYRWAHSFGYLGLHSVQWMPLYALGLFKLWDKPTARNAVRLTIFLVLALMAEYLTYAAYFIMFFTLLFVVYHFLADRKALLRTRFLLTFGLANLAGWLLMAPAYFSLLAGLQGAFREAGLVGASTDLLGFFMPSSLHPVLGPYVSHLDGYSNYMGYLVLGLVIVAVVKKRGRPVTFWLVTGLTAMILSLGPVLHCNGLVELEIPSEGLSTLIPLPYWLVLCVPFIQQLRAPGRMVATLELALSVLSAYGLQVIWRGLKSSRGLYKVLLFGAMAVLIPFESLFIFPFYVDTQSRIPPAVYAQIATYKDNLAVLEVPSNQTRTKYMWQLALYMYYVTVHQHPLVGGWGVRTSTKPQVFIDTTMFIRELSYAQEAMLGLPDIAANDFFWLVEQGARILHQYGIGYVVVHRALLEPEEEPVVAYMLDRALGPPFYDDGETVAYKVPLPPAPKPPAREKIVVGNGWYRKMIYEGHPARPMRDFGTIFVFEPKPKLARLKLSAFSANGEKMIDLLVNGAPIGTYLFTEDRPLTYKTRSFPLQAGQNEIALRVQQADEPDPTRLIHVNAFVSEASIEPALEADDVEISYPRRIDLENKIALLGYDLEAAALKAGQALHLTLYWQSLALVDDNYTVFTHLVDEQGQTVAQQDNQPVHDSLPTSLWGVGEVVEDEYQIPIPEKTPAGRYRLLVGMYSLDSGQRLAACDENGQPLPDNSIPLGEIEIERR